MENARTLGMHGPLGNHADQWSRWVRVHEHVTVPRSRGPPGEVPSGTLSVWSSLASVHTPLGKVRLLVFRLDVPRNTGASYSVWMCPDPGVKVRMEDYLYRILPGPSFLDRSWKTSYLHTILTPHSSDPYHPKKKPRADTGSVRGAMRRFCNAWKRENHQEIPPEIERSMAP